MTIAKELKPTHFFTLFFMPTAATLIKNGNKNGVGFSLQSLAPTYLSVFILLSSRAREKGKKEE